MWLPSIRYGTTIMRTYPVVTKEGTRSPAFEIENAYISPASVAMLLAEVKGVTDVQRRKMFAKSSDVHIEFKYLGQPYIVWEPYGDNSRYWIGPKETMEGVGNDTRLEEAFKRYVPPFPRLLLGDILTLRFITRFLK